jgi:hypothetical protein
MAPVCTAPAVVASWRLLDAACATIVTAARAIGADQSRAACEAARGFAQAVRGLTLLAEVRCWVLKSLFAHACDVTDRAFECPPSVARVEVLCATLR